MAYYERRPSGSPALSVTIVLIVVNLLVFLYSWVDRQNRLVYLYLIPAYVVQAGAWWQVVTYMFVHASWWHILFNMLALFLFGIQVEARMGHGEFLLFYFICGIGAGIVTLVVNNAAGMGMIPVVGASGAIFGLLLAFAAFFPYQRIYIFGVLPMQAPTAVVVFAGIEVVSQLMNPRSGVAHLAHLAGLAFGFFYLLARYRINVFSLFSRRR